MAGHPGSQPQAKARAKDQKKPNAKSKVPVKVKNKPKAKTKVPVKAKNKPKAKAKAPAKASSKAGSPVGKRKKSLEVEAQRSKGAKRGKSQGSSVDVAPTSKKKRRYLALHIPTLAQTQSLAQLAGKTPPAEALASFWGLMNARQQVANNRAMGLQGQRAYEGVPDPFAPYFARYCCPNVKRAHDRTTKAMHRIAAAQERLALCNSDAEREALKRLLVLNFAVWRFIGGTEGFARAVGFLNNWDEDAKEHIRRVVTKAVHEDRVRELFSTAYEGPKKLLVNLHKAAKDKDAAKLEGILYNRGPRKMGGEPCGQQTVYFTLQGKLSVMDELWSQAALVVKEAQPDPETGRTSWERASVVLGRVPFFGISDPKQGREPTFFAKEVCQDLLDTPVFSGGRPNVSDLRSFCPAGPGALKGLCNLYGIDVSRLPQRLAISLMCEVLKTASQPGGWAHGDPEHLELHDIQFMLCEFQKFLRAESNFHGLCNYGAPGHIAQPEARWAEWSDMLEEAVLLGRAKATSSANLYNQLAAWVGLPQLRPAGSPLQAGDRVQLKPSAGLALQLQDTKARVLCQTATPCNFQGKGRNKAAREVAPLPAAVFLLEPASKSGQGNFISYGEDIFLRSQGGAHLGPACDEKAVGAPVKAFRFEASRRVSLIQHVASAPGPKAELPQPVHSGDELELHWLSGRLAICDGRCVLLPEPSQGCARAASDTDTFVLELDLEPLAAAERGHKQLREALEASLSSGRLRSSCGCLEVVNPEPVRRRLVGGHLAKT